MLISKFSNYNVEEKIIDLERQYEIILPTQYKNFLHKYNGGYTPKTKFKAGKIYFCDHEKGNKVEYITESFKKFIECCKSEIISEASRRSIKEREDALIAKGRGNIITDDLRKMWQAEIDKYGGMVQEEVLVD